MENKTILDLFLSEVVNQLKSALFTAREKDENANAVAVAFDVADVLRTLGAKNVTGTVRVNKDYTWVDFEAQKDGFYHRLPSFGVRRQATRAELDAMKNVSGIAEAKCIAGLYVDDEGIKTSFRWDTIFTEDGEAIKYSGKVIKYNAETGTYDGPVAE